MANRVLVKTGDCEALIIIDHSNGSINDIRFIGAIDKECTLIVPEDKIIRDIIDYAIEQVGALN